MKYGDWGYAKNASSIMNTMEICLTQQQQNTRNLKIILVALITVLFGYYVYLNRHDFIVLLDVSGSNFVLLCLLIVATSFFNAAQNAVLIRAMGTPLSDLESFGLSNISAFVNFVIPQGLTITKAIYLKQRHSVSYSKFSALFLGLLVVFLLVGAILMALTNVTAALQGVDVPKILWLASFLGISSSLLFFFDFPKAAFEKFGKVGELMGSFSDGWKEIRSNKPSLFKACVWQLAIFGTSGIGISVAYNSIGIEINPLLGVSLAVFISFSNLLAIIPGNIGIQEVAYGYLSYASGLLFVQGVVISTLMRVASLFVTLIIAPFSWYFLFFRRRFKIR